MQRTVSLLGPTLRTTRVALEKTDQLATVLGPSINSLRPFARKLKPINDSLANLAKTTYQPVKNDIRPFVRNARQPVRNLRPAAKNLVAATPRLTTVGEKLNTLFNMAAYNPHGAEPPGTPGRDEGYLYWLGWLATSATAPSPRRTRTASTATSTWWPPAERSSRSRSPARSRPLVTGFGQLLGTTCPA